jgi:hypothetical protein
MLLDRIRNTGIALICVALAVAGWKVFAGRAADDGGAPSAVSVVPAAGRGELTIPVEIVEFGEEPRLHQVRVSP